MKKVKSNNKSLVQRDMPTWVAIVCAVVLGYLIYAMGVKKMDTRSSASEATEAGVVLPVASER